MKRLLFLVAGGTLLITAACSTQGGGPNVPTASSLSVMPAGSHSGGDVYTMSNATTGNAVLRYTRNAGGTLTFAGRFPTGGSGAGARLLPPLLGPSHTLMFDDSGKYLFVSDAGSRDVASFSVTDGTLRLIGRFKTHGDEPSSLATSGDDLYVLNAGSNSVTGFTIDSGKLVPISGSTVKLSGGPNDGPVDLRFASGSSTFARTATALVATQKLSNVIDVFPLSGGRPGSPVAHTLAGREPFGTAVSPSGYFFATEAFSGNPGASAVSSFNVGDDGSLTAISADVRDHQTAACWVTITPDDKLAFVSNTGSNTISSYTMAANGTIALAAAVAVAEAQNSSPTDIAASPDNRYVYVVNSASHTIGAFASDGTGKLSALGATAGLPPAAIGIAVR